MIRPSWPTMDTDDDVPTKFVQEPSSHLKCPVCHRLYRFSSLLLAKDLLLLVPTLGYLLKSAFFFILFLSLSCVSHCMLSFSLSSLSPSIFLTISHSLTLSPSLHLSSPIPQRPSDQHPVWPHLLPPVYQHHHHLSTG